MTNNNRLTNEELAQIRERSEMATAGRWFTVVDTIVQCEAPGTFEWDADHIGKIERKEDAIFIAEARTDIPKLLAEVKYLANQHLMSAVIISEKDAEIERLRNLINGGDSE